VTIVGKEICLHVHTLLLPRNITMIKDLYHVCLYAMKFATYQSSPVIKIAMDTAVGISLHELLHFLDI